MRVRSRVRTCVSVVVTAMIVCSATSAMAQPMQWPISSGGNDRFYEVVVVGEPHITWSAARDAASLRSFGGLLGQLVTPATAPEELFVRTLAASTPSAFTVNSLGDWTGPWIGGIQPSGSPEPDGNWSWISGDAWGNTNWELGEPNQGGSTGSDENAIQLFARAGAITSDRIRWNDLTGDGPVVFGFNVNAYVVEYSVVPAPPAAVLAGLGGLMSARRRR